MNIMDMSDEEFEKHAAESAEDVVSTEPSEATETTPVVGEPSTSANTTADLSSGSTESTEATEEAATVGGEVSTEVAEAPTEPVPAPEAKTEATETGTDDKPNLEEFYTAIMKPFKANGKDFSVRNAEEAIRLMQQGAGAGKRLQQLQPHLKTVKMLEEHNLLDPTRLSFLIDINSRKPEAIKQLLKEADIDPLDLAQENDKEYRPTDYSPSDEKMIFVDAVDAVRSLPHGDRCLAATSAYDDKSKEMLWNEPRGLETLRTQMADGTYDIINTEVERFKLLGQIPTTTPFLQAYLGVGNMLKEAGRLPMAQEAKSTQPQAQQVAAATPVQPTVLEVRPATPKPTVANSDKVRSAAATPSTPRREVAKVNPLTLDDEAFMKQFAGRF